MTRVQPPARVTDTPATNHHPSQPRSTHHAPQRPPDLRPHEGHEVTPMPADDPRHGTPAGCKAHARAGTKPCAACRAAKARSDKQLRVYGGTRVQLPEAAWEIVRDNNLRLLIRTTGVSECALLNIRRHNGDLLVYPKTLNRILAFDPITDEGLVRRVRALGAIGWSSRAIAAASNGRLHHESILKLQRPRPAKGDRLFIRGHVRDTIVSVYEELHMKVPTPTRSTSAAITRARKLGWEPPLAWDDIDDPAAVPNVEGDPDDVDELDHAVVARIMAGERIFVPVEHRAVVAEAIRESGRPLDRIVKRQGWNYRDLAVTHDNDQEAS